MKLERIAIDWMEKYGNDPRIHLIVDKIPKRDEMVFEKHGSLYYAVKDDFVEFFHYSSPGDGYAGRVFEITLTNGEKAKLIGPWSSRAGIMNNNFKLRCVEVIVNGIAGAVTIRFANAALRTLDKQLRLKKIEDHGDTRYVLRKSWKKLYNLPGIEGQGMYSATGCR